MIIAASGSQLDRLARCEASGALPQVVDANDDEERPDRSRGSAMHRFLDRVPEIGRDAALAEIDEVHRGFCAEIDLAKLADKLKLSREVAVAYNFVADTARLLAPIAHRAYEIDPACEVPLTLDLVGVGEDRVYIGDYKSGHGWLPEPEQSYQLGGGALAIARLFKKTRAQVEYIRIRDDGTPRKFGATLDVFGLESAAMRISHLVGGLPKLRALIQEGVAPDVVEGRWCKYCPAKQHCPAKTAMIRSVLGDPQPIPYLQPLTPESAQRAYALLKPAKDALAQVEAALYAYAKGTPIPVGVDEDGSLRYFGEIRHPGNEELDGAITHQVLTALYGGETANSAVTLEVTKKAVTDAIRRARPNDKITPLTEQVYEQVRARNGSKKPDVVSTREFTISPDGEMKARKRKAS